MASLAQLSTNLWRSSVKVPFLCWGADRLEGRHWEPPWLWPNPPEPLTALVLFVPVEGRQEEEEEEEDKKQRVWDFFYSNQKTITDVNGANENAFS